MTFQTQINANTKATLANNPEINDDDSVIILIKNANLDLQSVLVHSLLDVLENGDTIVVTAGEDLVVISTSEGRFLNA